MDEALRLGEEARGQSAPNPNVGCVIVSSSGRIIGRGATAQGGRPHAEAVALEQAGRRANGGDRLRHARALRARQPARPGVHRFAAGGAAGAAS